MGSFVPTAGAILAHKFELVRPLASGGMGTVWVAEHLELQLEVAIKFMETDDGITDARRRFEREARAAAKLRSPHVVQVLDYGLDGDTPYLVMEMLEGEDLRRRLDRGGNMSLREVAHITRQIAKGLELAHEAGFVHRDIKPANVFLAKVGQEEIAKILDFGVAKSIKLESGGERTTSSQMLGSPAYMSPEQARGAHVDHQSDLWSLGVVVYSALCGEHPFEGDNIGDLLVRICTDPLTPITHHRPDLPSAIDAFFDRALCRSRDGRFPSATALADALAAIAQRGTVSVQGPAEEPRDSDSFAGARDEPTIDAPHALISGRGLTKGRDSARRPAEADSLDPTGVTSPAALPPPRSRAWLFAAAGAAVVALAWIATQSLGSESVEAPAASASQEARETNVAASTTSIAGETAPVPAATVSASGEANNAPSATSSSAPPPPPRYTWPPRTASANATPPAPQPSGVDPKFGLPKNQ